MGIAYQLNKQRKAKANLQGTVFKMIRELSAEIEKDSGTSLKAVVDLLQATRKAADDKWIAILSPEDLARMKENLGECSICFNPLNLEEDLVLPVTTNRGCMLHCFHQRCLPATGNCPLCRAHYLSVRYVPKELRL